MVCSLYKVLPDIRIPDKEPLSAAEVHSSLKGNSRPIRRGLPAACSTCSMGNARPGSETIYLSTPAQATVSWTGECPERSWKCLSIGSRDVVVWLYEDGRMDSRSLQTDKASPPRRKKHAGICCY
jgi:hypothetical protein